jgi:hypothetical protein
MPALVAYTLNGVSGADHVFTPFTIDKNGVAQWIKAGDAPVGDERLSVSVNYNSQSGRYRTAIRLAIPKTQDIEGDGGVSRTTVVRTGYVNIEFVSDSTHTAVERGELLDLARSVLNATDASGISDAVVFNQPFY